MTITNPAGDGGPVRLDLPGRTLLLVAGMPGAGKSTLLAALPAAPGVVVVDSETYRAALGRLLRPLPYGAYRPLVHLLHRLAVLFTALSPVPTLVVHLPATDPATRGAVARLATLSRRAAHLLWLHVDPAEARRGQCARGRVVPEASFAGHAQRAAATTAALLAGATPPRWSRVVVLDRAAARGGLHLHTPRAARGGDLRAARGGDPRGTGGGDQGDTTPEGRARAVPAERAPGAPQ